MRRAGGGGNAISEIERLLRRESGSRSPPVHLWQPERETDIGLAIGAEGVWTHEGGGFERFELVKLLASVLRREPDGRYFLVTPHEKVRIHVADAPFMAVEIEVREAGRGQEIYLRTNVNDVVVCAPDHPLRFELQKPSGGLKPYVRIRAELDALATRAVYYELVQLGEIVERGGEDVFGLWSGGQFFEMAKAADLDDAVA